MSDTNRAVWTQKVARGVKFGIKEDWDCTIYLAKTKALISCADTAQLICAFDFAYIQNADFLMTRQA